MHRKDDPDVAWVLSPSKDGDKESCAMLLGLRQGARRSEGAL